MSGWIKKPRDRFKHPMFRKDKFCRGYAWDWLVDNAAYAPYTIEVSGRIVTLQRGQICHSIRFLAEKWNWDKAAVSRYLTRLKTETMINTQTETGQTIITICNYDKYNNPDSKPETVTETQSETVVRQQRDSSETKNKKINKINKINGSDDLFGENEVPKPKPPTVRDILKQVLPDEIVSAFIEFRTKGKKPLTPHAAKLAVAELKKLPDPVGSVNQTILNGWSGLFPVKTRQGSNYADRQDDDRLKRQRERIERELAMEKSNE